MSTPVTAIPPAASANARVHFAASFAFETDCWDVQESLRDGADFVLLDVRAPALFETGHVPGSINLPYGKIVDSRLADWPAETVFVVYCAGPHCNAATKAAVRLAERNRPVKIMLGGLTGWLDEGFPLASGPNARTDHPER